MTQSALSETPAPLVLLSYDVSAINRSAASRVAHLIFGRKDAGPDSPVPYILRAGVVWIGQSVFRLPRLPGRASRAATGGPRELGPLRSTASRLPSRGRALSTHR